jgi:murein DD-endopeptidase MepM/ murein hydrolase activator NlpD
MHAKEPQKGGNMQQTQLSPLQTQLIDQQVSELMADKVNTNTIYVENLADMEYLSYDDLLESEALRFPADELYGSTWDTCWVNPFRKKDIEVPDSFDIDCRAFSIPVDGELKVTSKYGPRRRRMHRGIDLKVHVGDTIRSSFSGKVRIKGFERRGYGNYLVIRHSNGLETIYGHLSKFLVSENEIVRTGQAIALGGNTGRSTGSHLHFETRFLGQALNPSDLIDFEKGIPYQEFYTLQKGKIGKTNVYTSTSERIVYHRVKKGETLGQIALTYRTTVNELCRLNGLSPKSTLRIGQSIRCGTTTVRTAKKETKTSSINTTATQKNETYHEVQSKETLSAIAKKYDTTVDALCRLNNIHSTVALREGQRLYYRAAAVSRSSVEEIEEQDANVLAVETANIPDETVGLSAAVSAGKSGKLVYHRVKQGDTLGAIAQKHGVTVNKLCEMNNITKTTILRIGRSLRCS